VAWGNHASGDGLGGWGVAWSGWGCGKVGSSEWEKRKEWKMENAKQKREREREPDIVNYYVIFCKQSDFEINQIYFIEKHFRFIQ